MEESSSLCGLFRDLEIIGALRDASCVTLFVASTPWVQAAPQPGIDPPLPLVVFPTATLRCVRIVSRQVYPRDAGEVSAWKVPINIGNIRAESLCLASIQNGTLKVNPGLEAGRWIGSEPFGTGVCGPRHYPSSLQRRLPIGVGEIKCGQF